MFVLLMRGESAAQYTRSPRKLDDTINYDHTKRRKPRRVTFFAAFAEWKENPEPAFMTRLDQMTIEEISSLLLKIDADKNNKFASQLIILLQEKKNHTN